MIDPKVSIIILNYNTYSESIKLAEMLYECLEYSNYEIIIVDNNSTNESDGKLQQYAKYKKCIYIHNEKNLGYAAGNNVGIKYAINNGAKYSLIINNDIEILDVHFLRKLVKFMEDGNGVAAVSPAVIKMDMTEDLPNSFRPNFWDLSFGCVAFSQKRKKQSLYDNMKVYKVKGCCMLLNNKDITSINYLDEDTFLYYEEDILAERLLNIYKECWSVRTAKVLHNHCKTVMSTIKKDGIISNSLKSYEIYLTKYRGVKSNIVLKILLGIEKIILHKVY